jgi:mono/diheme cytochrome c family protein
MKLLVGAGLIALTGLLAQAPEQVDAGRKIYESEKCRTCHQIDGQGNRLFPLDGVGARLTADEIRRWFTHTVEMENARPRRPAIRMSSRKYNFSDTDLDALVAYLLTLK